MNNNQPNQPKKPPKPGEAGAYIPHVNKGIAIVAIVLFAVLLVVPTLAWGGMYAAEAVVDSVINPIIKTIDPEAELIELNLIDKLNTDTGENRVMAKFPASFDPAVITVQLENWYNDNLPFRSVVYNNYKDSTNKFEKLFEERPDENTPSLREQIMEMFPTASQLKPPSVDVVIPGFDETEFLPFETEETLPTSEETLPPFEETLPPFEETLPSFDETLPPFEETLPEFPPIDDPDIPGGELVTEPGGKPGEDQSELPGVEPGTEPEGNPMVCEHVKGEGVVVTPSTCTEYGVMKYYCTKCNAYMGGEYLHKADHVKGEGVVDVEPTCTELGVMRYYCTVCDKMLSGEYIAALGHDYKKLNAGEDRLCGYYYDDKYECSNCQDTYTERTLKKHQKGNKIKSVEASYATYGYDLVRCRDCGGEYRMNLVAKLADNSVFTPWVRSDSVMEGRHKWLFYLGNDSQSYFKGTNLMTDAQLQEYVSVMTQLNNICKEKGITLQICIWPNKEQVYPEYVGVYPETNEKRIDRLVKYVRENSDVKIIYPIEELKAAKPYLDTYLKYDTHWNCAGGFIGYQAMLKSLGFESYDIRNCPVFEYTGVETENLDPYYRQISGDMIGLGKLNASDYKGDHNYYIKYRPEVVVDSKDGVDHSGNNNGVDGAEDTRHTTAANATYDLNFVMLADSYRVMQLGYLERDFSDCFLTHRSQVNDADVKEAIKNADVLVLAAVERLETDILAKARRIIEILSEQ